MSDETRLRFLTSIAKQLPVERVAEVHFFAPIKQGGVESGVAVIAVERELPITVDVDGGYVPTPDVAEVAPMETHEEVAVADELADEASFVSDDVVVLSEAKDLLVEEAGPSALPQGDIGAPVPSDIRTRFTVYSARYRHTLKGPDRGKWEVSVTEQADAPLITVDAVVRGVQRRSGDVDDIFRISGDEFRAMLPTAAA